MVAGSPSSSAMPGPRAMPARNLFLAPTNPVPRQQQQQSSPVKQPEMRYLVPSVAHAASSAAATSVTFTSPPSPCLVSPPKSVMMHRQISPTFARGVASSATTGHHPATTGHLPSTSGYHPATSGHHPATSGHLPVTSGHLPATSGHLPVTSGHLPATSGHLSVTSGHLPATIGHLPATSGHLPASSGHLYVTTGHHLASTTSASRPAVTSVSTLVSCHGHPVSAGFEPVSSVAAVAQTSPLKFEGFRWAMSLLPKCTVPVPILF